MYIIAPQDDILPEGAHIQCVIDFGKFFSLGENPSIPENNNQKSFFFS
jgi:hypothetical protein